jgi:hypothetical protein
LRSHEICQSSEIDAFSHSIRPRGGHASCGSCRRAGEAAVEAYRQAQQGEILPLPEIRARVRVRGADFIGADFDGRIYRLKFMRGGEVIWIDVDARTGQIIGRQ